MAKSSEGSSARKLHLNDDVASTYSPDKVVNEKVCTALSCLTTIKKLILECRFGLNGANGMSYSAIAEFLSKKLSPETKNAIISGRNGCSEISAGDIEKLEAQALRELSRAKKN